MRRLILVPVGIVLMAVGAVGWVIPVMPGWLFFILGLSLVAPRLAERWKQRLHRKMVKKELVALDAWKKWGVDGGFTTRHFPLFLSKTDDFHSEHFQESLTSHFSRMARAGGMAEPKRFIFLNQVHGGHVAILENERDYDRDGFYALSKTDAVLTSLSNLTLLALTADCLSVFFRAGRWVGLVHAGWRGTRDMITAKAFKLLKERSGCAAKDIHIIFGPRIGPKHYPVGEEFKRYFPKLIHRDRKIFFDLAAENKRQLLSAGALETNIFDSGVCTVDENEHFYSYRKEKEASGRMISFIRNL